MFGTSTGSRRVCGKRDTCSRLASLAVRILAGPSLRSAPVCSRPASLAVRTLAGPSLRSAPACSRVTSLPLVRRFLAARGVRRSLLRRPLALLGAARRSEPSCSRFPPVTVRILAGPSLRSAPAYSSARSRSNCSCSFAALSTTLVLDSLISGSTSNSLIWEFIPSVSANLPMAMTS